MDFADKLRALASRIDKQKSAIQTEEAAKTAFYDFPTCKRVQRWHQEAFRDGSLELRDGITRLLQRSENSPHAR